MPKEPVEDAMPKPLVRLGTMDDLKKVLFAQKVIAQEVRREMMSLVTTEQLATGKLSGPEEIRRVVLGQRQLLDKYAKYPTMSEFSFHPSLVGATKWGATFGVAIMVKAFVVDPVKAAMLPFAPFVRAVLALILKELNDPVHEYLIEPLEEMMRLRFIEADGSDVGGDKAKQISRKLIYQLAESILMVSAQYGLVAGGPAGFAITDLGRRVLLHMIDADLFLTELTAAHKKFQSIRPKLSVA
jgi:hypothetical protein